MKMQILRLVQQLSYYSSPIQEDRIVEAVLRDTKRGREGLSKEEIVEKGLNIYEKRAFGIFDLIKEAIDLGYATSSVHHKTGKMLQITNAGYDFLMSVYTNNYSPEYMEFSRELNRIFKEHGEPPLEEKHEAAMFWEGKTPEEASNWYFKPSGYHDEIEAYHRFLLNTMNKSVGENDFVFHFMPKLFLPREWMTEDISLKIEGIEVPDDVFLATPYPNKRYIVAGVKNGNVKTTVGFYPIIAPREQFPKEIVITLHWTIEGRVNISHKINVQFEFADHPGNFFSSEQNLSRSNRIPVLNLTTYVEQSLDFWKNRNKTFSSPKQKEYVIEEHVTLTNFPRALHSSFYADRNFSKWREQQANRDQ